MKIPRVHEFMTPAPKAIGINQTLEEARDYMRKLHVRQLPVVRGNKLIGVITDRDMNLILTFKDVDALALTVESALTPNPYFTSPQATLAEVSANMVKEKYGSVLVLENEKVVGIFTATDALKALAELFKSESAE